MNFGLRGDPLEERTHVNLDALDLLLLTSSGFSADRGGLGRTLVGLRGRFIRRAIFDLLEQLGIWHAIRSVLNALLFEHDIVIGLRQVDLGAALGGTGARRSTLARVVRVAAGGR